MSCGALVLAAGASTRFGRPKQLALLDNEILLERAVRVARAADCAPLVVVLGACEDLIRRQCDLRGVQIVSNPDWAEGMGSSLSAGVGALPNEPDGLLVLTCDMPAVTAQHLLRLAASGELTASEYAGRKGVPAYFPRACFAPLRDLKGDAGARELLRPARVIALEGGELDIDTVEQLEQAQRVMGRL